MAGGGVRRCIGKRLASVPLVTIALSRRAKTAHFGSFAPPRLQRCVVEDSRSNLVN